MVIYRLNPIRFVGNLLGYRRVERIYNDRTSDISTRINKAESTAHLISALGVFQDFLDLVLPDARHLQESTELLREELKAVKPVSDLATFQQRASLLVDDADLLLATPKPSQQATVMPTSVEHANLDREVTAIVTTRYFQAWPFKVVVVIFLAGLSVWGWNLTTSFEVLSGAKQKVENAEKDLRGAQDDFELAVSQLEGIEAEVGDARENLRAFELRIMRFVQEIGSPEKVRQEAKAEFLEKIYKQTRTQTDSLLNNLKLLTLTTEAVSLRALAERRGVPQETLDTLIAGQPDSIESLNKSVQATIRILVEHQLTAITKLDTRINAALERTLTEALGTPVGTVADFVDQRVAQINSELVKDAGQGRKRAFKALSLEVGDTVNSFDDLANLEIEELRAQPDGAMDEALRRINQQEGLAVAGLVELASLEIEKLRAQPDGAMDEALRRINQQEGLAVAGLVELASLEIEKLRAQPDGAMDDALRRINQEEGLTVASLVELANLEIGSVRRSAAVALDLAFEGLRDRNGDRIKNFDELAAAEIGSVRRAREIAVQQIEGARQDYLKEVELEMTSLPARIEAMREDMDAAESLATEVQSDLDVVMNLRDPLVRVSGYLEDAFQRSQISIAAVLGSASWFLVASVALAIVAFLISLFGLRAWLSLERKVNKLNTK